MSLKKVGNKKNKNISFRFFKKFIKKINFPRRAYKIKKDYKILLVFMLIHISLQLNEKYKYITKKYLFDIYEKTIDSFTKKELIAFLYDQTMVKYALDKKIDKLSVEMFFNNLASFYDNSFILNYFSKKNNSKFINIDTNGVENYVLLNKNLKFIMNFIKEISPTGFNWIYRKIVALS